MRSRVSSGSPYVPRYGFSRAVRHGDRIAVAGTAPIRHDGHVDPDSKVQVARCFEIMGAGNADAVGEAYGEVFRDIRPSSTMVVVTCLDDDRWKVEIGLEVLVKRNLVHGVR